MSPALPWMRSHGSDCTVASHEGNLERFAAKKTEPNGKKRSNARNNQAVTGSVGAASRNRAAQHRFTTSGTCHLVMLTGKKHKDRKQTLSVPSRTSKYPLPSMK
jgi:hypothetical protein